MIVFNEIPAGIRTPFTYVEFDASRATGGVPQYPSRLLVLGQAKSQAVGTVGVPTRITRDDQLLAFGAGSQLAHMLSVVRQNNAYTETWALPVGDPDQGIAAVQTLTLTGAATETALMTLWIGGRRVQVRIDKGTTAAEAATKIAADLATATTLAVTASASGAVVTFTARHLGALGNDIDIRTSFYPGERLPAGLTAVIAQTVVGAGTPDLADILAVLGGEQYEYIVQPWTESGFMADLEDELVRRAGPTVMREGICFTAKRGTLGELTSWGDARNCQFVSAMGAYASPTPSYEWAAAYGAIAAFQLPIDPARPIHTLSLKGVLPPAPTDRFTQQEQNILLHHGIATWMVSSDGEVQIQREITTFQKNAWGQPDAAWLDVQTPATLAFLRKDIRFLIETRFPRHKLASDGTRILAGQPIVTPTLIKDELIARASLWEGMGLVEGIEQFKREVVVERNQGDANRVDAIIPTNIVNQFRVFAGQLQFIV
ncbi:phage tail sheath subtilisin-like domain-containing protein [Lacibacterium aquatile]|uniref:Phage tail sheath subtilisin-like domain-containing protein n=1 Tax=Lacibacterium aquatile TaxID=1168082 RepID=A0ABW5DT79_9PROT